MKFKGEENRQRRGVLLGGAGATALGVGAWRFGLGELVTGPVQNTREWMQSIGLVTAGFGAIFIAKKKFLPNTAPGEGVGNNERAILGGVALIAGLGFAALSFGVDAKGEGAGVTVASSVTFEKTGEGATSSASEGADTTTTIASVDRGSCELELPLGAGDADGVRKIQAALVGVGYELVVDGDQGNQTNEALAGWKTANGFDPSERFNYAMCAQIPSLSDGDPSTP